MDINDASAVSGADKISEEILENIFSHLQRRDRQNARLVNHKWRRASYKFALMKNESTFIRNYRDFITTYTRLSEFFEPFRPVSLCLAIKANDVRRPYRREAGEEFWINNCDRLRVLHIDIDCAHFKFLSRILANCPQLIYLSVKTIGNVAKKELTYRCFKKVRFQNLCFLTIGGDKRLIPALVRSVVMKAPLLRSLIIICSHGKCFSAEAHNPFGTCKHLKCSKGLIEIAISWPSVYDYLVDQVTNYLGPGIRSIKIPNYMKVADYSSKFRKTRYKKIWKLVLGNWNPNTECFAKLLSMISMKYLTVVSIVSSQHIHDDAVIALRNLQFFCRLNVSQCKVSNRGIIHFLGFEIDPKCLNV